MTQKYTLPLDGINFYADTPILKDNSIPLKRIMKGRTRGLIRIDGSMKGSGWLGVLKTNSGKDMTEYSIGVNLDGRETLIPTVVPTLTEQEIELLKTEPKEIPESIINKAIAHAIPLLQQGKSPFKQNDYSSVLQKLEKDDWVIPSK